MNIPPTLPAHPVEPLAIPQLLQQLYWCYNLCNCVAWQGRLPRIVIRLDTSTLHARHAARAIKNGSISKHGFRHVISFTLCNLLHHHNTRTIIIYMLHEMTHIWQYVRRGHSCHDTQFYGEMYRLGINEANYYIAPNSIADNLANTAAARYPALFKLLHAVFLNSLPANHTPHYHWWAK